MFNDQVLLPAGQIANYIYCLNPHDSYLCPPINHPQRIHAGTFFQICWHQKGTYGMCHTYLLLASLTTTSLLCDQPSSFSTCTSQIMPFMLLILCSFSLTIYYGLFMFSSPPCISPTMYFCPLICRFIPLEIVALSNLKLYSITEKNIDSKNGHLFHREAQGS